MLITLADEFSGIRQLLYEINDKRDPMPKGGNTINPK